MAPKIFLTGATGYIGGDVLNTLITAHPDDYDYTVLVRGSEKATAVAAAYPKLRVVIGTLDDAAIIQAESAKADIVIDTADSADHVGAATAIAKGIAAGHTPSNPAHWIHLSGTGILTWKDVETGAFGEPPSQPPYNDLEGVKELTSLPDAAFHRNVDKIVLGTNSAAVKTAIICPPMIYGRGRGPSNRRSIQVYDLAAATLKRGQAPVFGRGLTEWDNVHIHDLSNLFVSLVEAVGKKPQDPELWGENGYFLAENGHHVWGEVSRQIAEVAAAQGYIKSTQLKPATIDEAKEMGVAGVTYGLNSKGIAKRGRKYLGWNPKGKSLEDEMPEIVASEAARLGLKTHKA